MKVQKQILFFGILTTVFVAVFLGFSALNHDQSVHTQKWVSHTGKVITELDNIEALTSNIESNTRGFVISNSKDFISDLSIRRKSIYSSIEKLKQLNDHNAAQYKDILNLEKLVDEKIRFNDLILWEHYRDPVNGGKVLITSLKGKVLMDKILHQIERIKSEEANILSNNISRNIDSIENSYSVQWSSALIAFAVIIGILYVLNSDMNNRKKAESSLAESQRRMSAILNSAKEAVILISKDSTLILVNQHANEMSIHHSGKELKIGMKFLEFFPEDKKPYYQAIFDKVYAGDIQVGDVQLNSPHGTRWYETIFYPVMNDKGIVENICISTRDITDRLKYQEDLLNAKKKAESAERLQETFLANMSHEIRTPMNGIVGMTDILSSTVLSNEQRNIVKTIKKSSDTLLFLINDILDLSKIKAGKLNIEKVPFEVNDVLDTVFTPFDIKARFQNISFEVKSRPRFPLHVVGDQYRLIQILNNVLGNAIKFTKQGGVTVDIFERKHNEKLIELEFVIADTGIGIEQEKIESIFKSFEQGTNNITREFGGTGLGLAITKKLIEMQNGSISVESVYGKGATFRFAIPFEIPEKQVYNTVSKSDHATDFTILKGRRILVAEDNDINQLVITQTLRKVGINITIANNGKEAVDLLSSGEQFDLMIMDLHMPQMDGYRATEFIRNELKLDLPIIAMTASVMRDERSKCIKIGMNEYLAKPFEQAELYATISKLLGENPAPVIWEKKEEDALYDLQFLNELGDEKYTGEVLSQFLNTTPGALITIKKNLEDKNPEQLFFTVHRLKSSLGLLKINGMLNTCHLIESLTRDKKMLVENEWKQCNCMISDLLKQFEELRPLIEKELNKRVAIY